MYYATDYISPLGRVKLTADGEALIGLWLEGQKYFGGKVKEEFVENRSLPVLENAKDWLDRYFAGKKPEISELPLAPMGSAFQQGVRNTNALQLVLFCPNPHALFLLPAILYWSAINYSAVPSLGIKNFCRSTPS